MNELETRLYETLNQNSMYEELAKTICDSWGLTDTEQKRVITAVTYDIRREMANNISLAYSKVKEYAEKGTDNIKFDYKGDKE